MRIVNCRNCKSPRIERVFSLGNIFYTGKFPKKKNESPKRGPINVVMCKKCTLVQLENNFDLNYLYGPDYGYRTGINTTMTNHVKKVVNIASKITKLKKNDQVLDIASNDGTLLNFYDKKIITFGIDPIIKKYKENYKNINYKISNFFSANKIKNVTKNKFKIITALSVFYDLKNPNKFLKGMKSILDDNGIIIIELADLGSIVEKNIFDTFCHEHLEYYSLKVINEMCKKNSLRLFNIKQNDINGGSLQFYICKNESNFKNNESTLIRFFNREKLLRLNKKQTFTKFIHKVDKIKIKLRKFLDKALKNNKKIHGYGASTKGNVLLQYFNLTSKHIDFIAEKNSNKYGCYTPGTKIKIISEKLSRKLKPDYYLVLPWHFKNEILKRENMMLRKNTKFIFPLPNLKIINN